MKQTNAKSPCRVLVVDDNRDSADSLAMLLRFWGHHAWVAYDGPSALALAQAQQPDVVLLDLALPQMDGYQVAWRLREEVGLKDAMLVALTGYGQESDRQHTQEAGFCHHLLKPVDPALLEHLLNNLCHPSSSG
jgi:CheY-like chemotaxis protein